MRVTALRAPILAFIAMSDDVPRKKKNKRPGKRDRERMKTEAAEKSEEQKHTEGKRSRSASDAAIIDNRVGKVRQDVGDDISTALQWNFEVDYNDHFETPLNAFQDLLPCLRALGATGGSVALEAMTLYDPYWCQGRMRALVRGLGVRCVLNENRDFYADVAAANAGAPESAAATSGESSSSSSSSGGDVRPPGLPAYDVLMTNPPYSGDHKARLLAFLRSAPHRGRPAALLLPTYTAGKSYWREHAVLCASNGVNVAYLLPASSYEYTHPEGTGKDAPPFHSCWFLTGFPPATELRAMLAQAPGTGLSVTTTVDELVARGLVQAKRRGPKARKKQRQS